MKINNLALGHVLCAPIGQDGVSAAAGGEKRANLRKSKHKISNSFVVDGSYEKTYIHKLVLFMLYLFDDKEEKNLRKFINPSILIPAMEENDDAEDHRVWEAEKEKSSTSGKRKRKTTIVNNRANLSKYIEERINDSPPVGGKSPLDLEGDNAIHVDVITDYMLTRINCTWIDPSAAEEYIKTCKNLDVTITQDMIRKLGGKVQVTTMQSKSQYNGIRSALVYLFTLAHVQQPTTLTDEMSTFLKGLDRTFVFEGRGKINTSTLTVSASSSNRRRI